MTAAALPEPAAARAAAWRGVLRADDLRGLARLGIDGVVAVAGPAPAEPSELATLADQLGRTGCELLGTIENRIAASRPNSDTRHPTPDT